MSEIVERVAKAMFDAQPRTAKLVWEELPDGYHAEWIMCARAGIEAMRPRGCDLVPSGAFPGMTPQQYFNALIDAALR